MYIEIEEIDMETEDVPIEERKPIPWVSYTLLTVIVVCFLVSSVFAWQDHEFTSVWSWLFLSTDASKTLIGMGAVTPQLIWTQPWRLLTYTFLHNGLLHLVLNVTAFSLAVNFERRYGWRLLLCLYAVAGVVGGIGGTLFGSLLLGVLPVVYLVGASTSLYGLFAVDFIYELKKTRLETPHRFKKDLIMLILICTPLLFLGNPVGHVGGLLVGIVFALGYPKFKRA